eukprot:CAMPEP_0185848618 /NCGR_PEP_ID=MMETSP1354-20130828/3430_1 /TAXON_ID=708628 /ORGANISM="Erythrolobus madagascarensis, Strain CCMP3276" /LENGTH=116 /DNA_ID=CAMNT_0028549033 /DNA_START=339 /DNA_END=685 /DNA_ORIENTATION=+
MSILQEVVPVVEMDFVKVPFEEFLKRHGIVTTGAQRFLRREEQAISRVRCGGRKVQFKEVGICTDFCGANPGRLEERTLAHDQNEDSILKVEDMGEGAKSDAEKASARKEKYVAAA